MDENFYDGHDELYRHAKFGDDRTTLAGCRCENVVFVFFCLSRSQSGAPCVRGVHSSNTFWVAVYRPISTRFAPFFRNGLHFQTRYIVLTYVARWRHNFRKIAVKNCEKSKNRRKSLCAPLRIDSWGIWKKFYRSSLEPGLQMYTYIKNCSARRYLALTASVKFRKSSPKTARNEQVCAHQKSYRK